MNFLKKLFFKEKEKEKLPNYRIVKMKNGIFIIQEKFDRYLYRSVFPNTDWNNRLLHEISCDDDHGYKTYESALEALRLGIKKRREKDRKYQEKIENTKKHTTIDKIEKEYFYEEDYFA